MEFKKRPRKPGIKNTDAGRAFRRYAEYGFDRRGLGAFEICDAIRGVCPSKEAALDMLAVYDTMRLLRATGNADCAEAVREVYFVSAGRRLRRNDITYRVRRHAFERSYDERTVYRQLERAKELYRRLRY
jgi:hypothetical protein